MILFNGTEWYNVTVNNKELAMTENGLKEFVKDLIHAMIDGSIKNLNIERAAYDRYIINYKE